MAHKTINILYIHGMGGGGDSRIPSILNENINSYIPESLETTVNVIVRTYSFDPEKGHRQILGWVEELEPQLIVGESLGAVQAIRVRNLPHILVSPSLNAPLYLGYLAFLAWIPGMTWLLDKIYKPKEGDRQQLHFTFGTLRKYRAHRRDAMTQAPSHGGRDSFFAFFGKKDHYRKSGIVSVRTWRKHFGDSYMMYGGTHFMEDVFIRTLLIPKILDTVL